VNRPSMKKIAVLIDPNDLHLSGYLRGIRDFARESSQWILHGINLPCYHEIFDFKNWTGDGCLAFDQSEETPSTPLFRNCPHRVTLGKIAEKISSITFDEKKGITSALQHLAGQGCRSITFHGPAASEKISTIRRLCHQFDLHFVDTILLKPDNLIRSTLPTPAIIVPDCQHALEALRIAAKNNSPRRFTWR
jgi:DNA-binding LacI/PurR family transcriptional regulator